MGFLFLAVRAVLGFVLACASSSSAASELVLVVRPSVVVQDLSLLELRDLLASPNDVPASKLLSHRVETTGESRAGQKDQIVFGTERLKALFAPYQDHLRSIGRESQLRVPNRVQVVAQSRALTAETARANLLRILEPMCGDCEIEILALRLPKPKGEIEHWQITPPAELPRGEFSIQLVTVGQDGRREAQWLTGSISVRREVIVALRSLPAGEQPQARDIRSERRETTYMAGQPATADEVRSSTLLRPVGAGQIIFGSALKREFAVKNGQPVKVIVNGASWSVATEAVAQGSGYVGDLVRARVNRSSRVVSGRVNSDGQLEVQ